MAILVSTSLLPGDRFDSEPSVQSGVLRTPTTETDERTRVFYHHPENVFVDDIVEDDKLTAGFPFGNAREALRDSFTTAGHSVRRNEQLFHSDIFFRIGCPLTVKAKFPLGIHPLSNLPY